MTPEEATKKLAALTATADDAAARYDEARSAARRSWEAALEVMGPLTRYHAAVLHRQRQPDPSEARRLSLELLRRIRQERLQLEPIDPYRPAAGLRIANPKPAQHLIAAEKVATEARRSREEFAIEHAELLAEDANRTTMGRVRDALDADDPARLRAALDGLPTEDRPARNVVRTS
jgi:hypothetical protein